MGERCVLLISMVTMFMVLERCHGLPEIPDFFEEKVSTYHIGGKVLCQDCSKGWQQWLSGTPIEGCKVSVTCMDMRQKVVYYGSDETNEKGVFEMVVSKNVTEDLVLQPEFCSVHLVSSPHPDCNVASDFMGGNSGISVGLPSMVFRDTVHYTVGPFYYTTPMCQMPDLDGN